MSPRVEPRIRDQWLERVKSRFTVDARGLAALRISFGVLLLLDLLIRSFDLVVFYTDAGVLPRSVLRSYYPTLSVVSIHTIGGSSSIITGVFLIQAGFALALLVGYRTRVATVGSFLFLVSLHARNPVLLNAGDSLLRRFLFWGMFLPLGARWSVDAISNDRSINRVTSLASAAILLQVVIVYTVNGLFKLRGDLWLEGSAVRYIFSLDQLTIGLGNFAATQPGLLTIFDRIWLIAILSSALLVITTGYLRGLIAGVFMVFHVGMFLTLRLGLFPLISIAVLLPFLPSGSWDRLSEFIQPQKEWLESHSRQYVPVNRPTPRKLFRVANDERITSGLIVSLLLGVLLWNGMALGYVETPRTVSAAVDPADYRWDMFAPNPRSVDGWYVIPGTLESGDRVDAFHHGPVTWDRPPDLAATYPSHRWFVYLIDLRQPAYAELRSAFASYLCQQWNRQHHDKLIELTIVYLEQPTRLDGPEPIRSVELGTFAC